MYSRLAHYVAEGNLELLILLPPPPRAEITAMCQHIQFHMVLEICECYAGTLSTELHPQPYLFIYLLASLMVCVCLFCITGTPGARRGHCIPWKGVMDGCWPSPGFWGSDLGALQGQLVRFNHWASSPALTLGFLETHSHLSTLIVLPQ